MKNAFNRLIALLFAAFAFTLTACGADFVGNKIYNGVLGDYTLDFSALNRSEKQTVTVKEDESVFDVEITVDEGRLDIEIFSESGEKVYVGNDLQTASFSLDKLKKGRYDITVTGEKAKGKVVVKIRGNEQQ
ncbi:MAG TPA: hypothetical protein DDY77_05105 [Clostridiales bacterium]|nr:hypothetical protein [Clostridiales bacterium]